MSAQKPCDDGWRNRATTTSGDIVPDAVIVLVVWIVVLAAVAAVAIQRSGLSSAVRHPVVVRLSSLGQQVISTLGRPATALAAYLMGFAAILIVCWPLGLLAHALQNAIDWPVFHWFESRQLGPWSDLWWVLTNIGKPRITQGVAALGGVIFAVIWQRTGRRWWVPLVVFASGYALEKYVQIILQTVVHRGHPPTTHGTYPSGGCARVLIVYGLVVFAVVLWRWPQSRRAWTTGAAIVSGLWTIQAYARIYNLEHWFTDVVGGTVFGLLGLTLMTVCLRILTPIVAGNRRAAPRTRHDSSLSENEGRATTDSHSPA